MEKNTAVTALKGHVPWWTSVPILLVVLMATTTVSKLGRADKRVGLYAAGEAALAAQQWDEALSHFETLHALEPSYRDVSNKLNEVPYLAGLAYLASGEFDRAIAKLQQVISIYEDAEAKLVQAFDGNMVYVPAGEFLMGSDTGDVDERPQRRVYLDAFEIDKYEVTNVQYRRFLLATGHDAPQRWPDRYVHLVPDRNPDWHDAMYPPGEATYPVAGVNWQGATDYCAWVGKRLPTEAEWEKAARGTDGRIYPWGNTWEASKANTRQAAIKYTQPVGTYPAGASPWGALDMTGNVWEWAADLYDRTYYSYAPERNPQGPPSGTGERVLRGGAWDSSPDHARVSYRNATHSFAPNFRVGFRCARSP